jgi:hypothetical protein
MKRLLLATVAVAATIATDRPALAEVPVGPTTAKTKGVFGPAVYWPIMPIHAAVLPDGRVLTYGTDEDGQQGGQFVYDVWNPTQGLGSSSHLTLPNGTGTDIFCSAQTIISGSGEVLITGGDAPDANGDRGGSNADTEIFNPKDNTLRPTVGMTYARWYPSAIATRSNDIVILGGRQELDVDAPTPEVYNPATGWRMLTGAYHEEATAFPDGNWYYPKAFVQPSGNILVLGNWTVMWSITTAGAGSITELPVALLPGDYKLPSLTYAAGKVLSLRANKKVQTVNMNTNPPQVSNTGDIDQVRFWANMSVIADGKVLVTGGSRVDTELVGVAYNARIWNPSTGAWTTGAAAAKPRLYHSISLLLPDGSVLTAGGGAPGPVNNLNAEIYYPGYLYQSNGQPAIRPIITNVPATVKLGNTFTVTTDTTTAVSKVAIARAGSVTHSFNPDQRYLGLKYTQSGANLMVKMTSDPDVAIPGYYLLFIFKGGVPSIAKIIKVTL